MSVRHVLIILAVEKLARATRFYERPFAGRKADPEGNVLALARPSA
jgi:predicted enzyme related to lactoylglutathione lyase